MSYVRHRAEREAVGLAGKMLYAFIIATLVVVVAGAVLVIALALWLTGVIIFLIGKAIEALSKGEHGGKTVSVGESIVLTPLRLVRGARNKMPKGTVTVVQPPPPALPSSQEYEILCPSCGTALTSKAGENIGCPVCKAHLNVAAP